MTNRVHLPGNQSGQTLAEFGVVASAFLTLLLGIFYFGAAIYAYNSVSNAAHDGVRWASVRGNTAPSAAATTDVQKFVTDDLQLDHSGGQLTVTPQWCQPNISPCTSGDNAPGSVVQVTVLYNYVIGLPLIGAVTLPLASTAQMVISQ